MRIMFLSQSPERPNDKDTHNRTQVLLQSYASPGTEIELHYPDDFPGARVFEAMGAQTNLTGLHHAMEAPALVQKAVWAEHNGYDAVIQSNTFDPGVEASRLAVRIPMIGVFRATLHTAATLCDRIAITVPLDGHVTHTWRILRSYGMEGFVEDIRPIGIYGEALVTRKDELYGRTVDLMKALKNETRAQMLLPLGGALIPYVVSPDDLAREAGLPVLNTKAIGIRFAETCVGLGMAHSPRAYPNAGLKPEDFTQKAFA